MALRGRIARPGGQAVGVLHEHQPGNRPVVGALRSTVAPARSTECRFCCSSVNMRVTPTPLALSQPEHLSTPPDWIVRSPRSPNKCRAQIDDCPSRCPWPGYLGARRQSGFRDWFSELPSTMQ